VSADPNEVLGSLGPARRFADPDAPLDAPVDVDGCARRGVGDQQQGERQQHARQQLRLVLN